MAARRLVLNGLTAEVAGTSAPGERSAPGPPSPEFYHELELYRQLLALSARPERAAPNGPGRRARTPDPPPSRTSDETARRCRTPAPAPAAPLLDPPAPLPAPPPAPPLALLSAPLSAPPSTSPESAPPASSSCLSSVALITPVASTAKPARYLGSFPAAGGEQAARVDTVTRRLHLMKQEGGCAVPVLLVVALSGVEVRDPDDQSVRMSHALRRISYATCESARALFAFVAREPRAEPHTQYCHAFETDSPDQAEELNALVGDAFRMAFASQLQPSAPLWSKELSGGSCARAPDSLPGLAPCCPRRSDRSPIRCDIMGGSKAEGSASEPSEGSEASPSSSEEWNSPTELSCYRRLGERFGERLGERHERPPLMKRLALGLSGALLQPSDDDATPLVTDTPTTPTNVPLCLNGGYINEARDNRSRRETESRTCGLANGRAAGSAAASSSSGESSCGASRDSRDSRDSGNNNQSRPTEPELKHAPWFQQGIPREIALEVLGAQPPGAFLVRASTTQSQCLALSLRVPPSFAPRGIAHYLILRTGKGYKIKGFTKEFSSLSALVTHHSVMPELLPVPLRLPRPRPPRPPHADLEPLDRLAPPPTAPPSAPPAARPPYPPHPPRPHVDV